MYPLATLATVILIALAPRGATGANLWGFDLQPRDIPIGAIVSGGPPKDGIPALDEPDFVTAEKAAYLDEHDLVVGLADASEAKAYPLRILNWHEIVNDRAVGRAVAVTYCPLTGSAVVFDRGQGQEELSFGVSGLLYQSNLLMFDRTSESLWSQLAGRAVAGARTGTPLEVVPSTVTTWKEWKKIHPTTRVLSKATGHERNYSRDPYEGYGANSALMFPVHKRDLRLPVKELVLGVTVGETSRAYPLPALAEAGFPVHDSVGNATITIADVHGPVRLDDGTVVAGTIAYWFAWAAFNEDTEVWGLASPESDGSGHSLSDVSVSDVAACWDSFGNFFLAAGNGTPFGADSVFVLGGTLNNVSERPVHHVVLLYELLGADGETLYEQEGYNRAAEALLDGQSAHSTESTSVQPIAPMGSDTFRMIFFSEELPKFSSQRISVVEVH